MTAGRRERAVRREVIELALSINTMRLPGTWPVRWNGEPVTRDELHLLGSMTRAEQEFATRSLGPLALVGVPPGPTPALGGRASAAAPVRGAGPGLARPLGFVCSAHIRKRSNVVSNQACSRSRRMVAQTRGHRRGPAPW